MKCAKCGHTEPNGMRFCSMCGSPMAVKGSASKGKRLLWLLLGVCLVTAFYIGKTQVHFGGQPKVSNSEFFRVDLMDGDTLLYYGDRLIQQADFGQLERNLIQTAAVAKADEMIAFMTPEKYTTVEKVVRTYSVAADSSRVVYLTHDDEQLILRDMETDEEEVIIEGENVFDPIISPDGKSVVFSIGYGENGYMRVYTDGELQSEGMKACEPIAITDGAGLLYIRNHETLELTVSRNGGEPVRLAKFPGLDYYLNFDNSQVLFQADKGKAWYVADKGKKVYKVAENVDDLEILLPPHTAENGFTTITYNIKSFAEHYYYSDKNGILYRIGKDWSVKTVAEGVDQVVCVDDRTVVYSDGRSLFLVEGTTVKPAFKEEKAKEVDVQLQRIAYEKGIPYPEKKTLAEEGIDEFAVSADGKEILFLTNEDNIYYGKVGRRPKLVTSEGRSVCLTHDDEFLFTAKNEEGKGVLYFLRNRRKAVAIDWKPDTIYVGKNLTCYLDSSSVFVAVRTPKFEYVDRSDWWEEKDER